VKRIIGIGGDHVQIKDGNLYINGEVVKDARVASNYYYNHSPYGEENKETIVPEGKYFFLGDNSISSLDSRFWGFADYEDVIGQAIFIWWPPNRIGLIE